MLVDSEGTCFFQKGGGAMADNTESGDPAFESRIHVFRDRTLRLFDRAERDYLTLLRIAVLIGATALLLGATWLFGAGLFKQFGSSNVQPVPALIQASDIAPVQLKSSNPARAENSSRKAGPPEAAANRAYALYKQHFQKFQRPQESAPNQKAVVDAVWGGDRLQRLAALDLSLLRSEEASSLKGGNPSNAMLDVLEGAAREEGMISELQGYRNASKVRVCRDEVRNRSRVVPTWDSRSMSCSNWDVYPYGCMGERSIDEPYLENVCEMRFPADVETPLEQMGNAADRFISVSEVKIEQARNDASERSAQVVARRANGRNDISQSGMVFLGFISLIFLYLLVVIERHYRAMSAWFVRRDAAGEK